MVDHAAALDQELDELNTALLRCSEEGCVLDAVAHVERDSKLDEKRGDLMLETGRESATKGERDELPRRINLLPLSLFQELSKVTDLTCSDGLENQLKRGLVN